MTCHHQAHVCQWIKRTLYTTNRRRGILKDEMLSFIGCFMSHARNLMQEKAYSMTPMTNQGR